jgi:hypothetical protein
MTSLFAKWTFLLAFPSFALLYLSRFTVDQEKLLLCSANGLQWYYTTENGSLFMSLHCLTLILTSLMVRTIFFEGVITARLFGEYTPASTYCMSLCFCWGGVYDNTYNGQDEDQESNQEHPKEQELGPVGHHKVQDHSHLDSENDDYSGNTITDITQNTYRAGNASPSPIQHQLQSARRAGN